MNDNERLNLQKMIQENNTENNTNLIRELKHSKQILKDVDNLLSIKQKYARLSKSNPDDFDNICINKCSFLFNHYTDIYNKVLNDEINLQILQRLLNVLHLIEEGEVDQHEGSFQVGKLLKAIYIDSALKKSDKLNEQNDTSSNVMCIKPISWRDYKLNN
jgi:hypothetical protein